MRYIILISGIMLASISWGEQNFDSGLAVPISDGAYAEIYQFGNNNQLYALQRGKNILKSVQMSNNILFVTQQANSGTSFGNSVESIQGYDNIAVISQFNYGNKMILAQDVSNTAGIVQFGTEGKVNLKQNYGNSALILQFGHGDNYTLNQDYNQTKTVIRIEGRSIPGLYVQ